MNAQVIPLPAEQIVGPDDIDFRAYMRESEPRVKVRPAESWASALERMIDEPRRITGAKLPWSRTHDILRFRPGEVTVWAGISGHGKSLMLGQAVLGFVAQGERSCIASLEMPPDATLERMMRQAAMCDAPAREFVRKFTRFLTGKLWIYDHVGSVRPEILYGVMRYCAEQLRIQHMVIDNLQKCIRGTEDRDGEKNFVDMLTRIGKETGMHIHLVHHVRKGDSEDRPRGKDDVKGSSAIIDLVDQLIIAWRNKPKERAVQKLIDAGLPIDADTESKPDALLLVEKNRHLGWEGRIPLWYDVKSEQYTGAANRRLTDFIGGGLL